MPCIWYVSKYVSLPSSGSAGNRGYMIMRELAHMQHQCVIITSDSNHLTTAPILSGPYLLQEVDGLQVWWVRTMKYRLSKSLGRILSWLDFEWRLFLMPLSGLAKPDAIIVSSLSLLTILNGFLLRRRFKCRLVFEIRDIWPLTLVEEGGYSSRHPLVLILGLIEKMGYRYSDAIVGTMPNLGEHVRSVLGKSRPTFCVPMGVDPSMMEVTEAMPPEYIATYIPQNKFIVAHVGSIGITNALDTFLECAASFQTDTSIHFLLVGDGDLRLHYQERYGHLQNITFGPKVPKTLVQSVLAHCDLVYFSVHVSAVWNFGQSLNKIIDYMLAGKPILASYTGFPSMINEAGCGDFVPAGDLAALKDKVKYYSAMDPGARSAMGSMGRDWILSHRRYETLASTYLSIITTTINAERLGQ